MRDGRPSVKEDEASLADQSIEEFGLLSVLPDAIDRAYANVAHSVQQKNGRDRHGVAADWESYTRDPAKLAAAREAITNLIMEL